MNTTETNKQTLRSFTLETMPKAVREELLNRQACTESNQALRKQLKKNQPKEWVMYQRVIYLVAFLTLASVMTYCWIHKIGY